MLTLRVADAGAPGHCFKSCKVRGSRLRLTSVEARQRRKRRALAQREKYKIKIPWNHAEHKDHSCTDEVWRAWSWRSDYHRTIEEKCSTRINCGCSFRSSKARHQKNESRKPRKHIDVEKSLLSKWKLLSHFKRENISRVSRWSDKNKIGFAFELIWVIFARRKKRLQTRAVC